MTRCEREESGEKKGRDWCEVSQRMWEERLEKPKVCTEVWCPAYSARGSGPVVVVPQFSRL